MFGDHSRRNINLGGRPSTSTQADLVNQVKAIRQERDAARRQTDAARRIQAWTRACQSRRRVQADIVQELRHALVTERRPTSERSLRLLALVKPSDPVVDEWASVMMHDTQNLVEASPALANRAVLVLIRAACSNPSSITTLQLLTQCLTPDLTAYLLNHGIYASLSEIITSIPVSESKSHPALPLVAVLIGLPTKFFPPQHLLFPQIITDITRDILSIWQLPNRLPIAAIPEFVSCLPITSLHLVQQLNVDPDRATNILANMMMFIVPRYSTLKTDKQKSGLLNIYSSLLAVIPIGDLAPPVLQSGSSTLADADMDSDVEDDSNAVKAWTSRSDGRTLKRIEVLHSTSHIHSLVHFPRAALVTFILSLSAIFPVQKSHIYNALLNAPRGAGIVGEVWRLFVRTSNLREGTPLSELIGPSSLGLWPPLIFLAEIYTQLLRTMDDGEFFGSSSIPSTSRNPITTTELPQLARMFTYITYTLQWNATYIVGTAVPSLPLSVSWADVVRAIGSCITALHERDSRRQFIPPQGWIMQNSAGDVDSNTFIEAAVFEDQQEKTDLRPGQITPLKLAQLTPRLAILSNIPFAIPFETRVAIFRAFVMQDRLIRDPPSFMRPSRNKVVVRRGNVAQDGFDRLAGIDLKKPLEIVFIDQFGEVEAGIDGGGVFKEFFTSLCREVFDTDRGLWLVTKNNELYPNPHSYATEPHSLNWYRFLGRILGKALYEGILVDVAFAGFFLAKWLGKQSLFNDLASLDPELYQGLMFLKHHQGDLDELSLNFTVAVEEFGDTKALDLIPNGSNIPVTKENRARYILMVANYRLSKQIRLQSNAFFEGLSEMIEPKWLRMFDPQEVQILMGGVNQTPDLDDLRKNTQYGGVYDSDHATIQTFWDVLKTFDDSERRAFLRFVTSCSRPPLLGFKELVPQFAIRDSGLDQARLPTSSTCVNLLKLPQYQTAEILRAKLKQAIDSGAGFDLS